MFTQCSKCETVFRLSAEALRAAGGQVRCGRCGEVFNALARLAEDANGFTKGESSLDLETRADEILQSTDADELESGIEGEGHGHGQNQSDGEGGSGNRGEGERESVEGAPSQAADTLTAPPGVEIAQLQILNPLDEDPSAETSLEFTLPPGELDRIFIETRRIPLQQFTVEGARGGQAQEPMPVAPAPASETAAVEQSAHRPSGPLRETATLTRIAGLEVSEDVRREMLKSYSHAELPEINAPRSGLPLAVWLCAAAVLAILLGAQIVYGNSGWLGAHTHLLGGSRTSAVTLSSYQLRQWGVSGDPGAKGTLRVRASIMNVAAQLQPYPLLRVALANRFGSRVGSREFEPVEYLGKPPARMLAPGEQVDAVLDILDPGQDAEGFEIDVCLRDADRKIHCAGDAAAQAK